MTEEVRYLILETSGRIGQVGVGCTGELRAVRRLDETRRHARDLAPAVSELLAEQHWQPRDIHAVVVSQGPGSYTGLRVGIMSAKAFAYATGCALIAVESFAAIASQVPPTTDYLDVISDAQQDRVYVQRFARAPQRGATSETQQSAVQIPPANVWLPAGPLRIQPFAEWLTTVRQSVTVSGPGLQNNLQRLPAGIQVANRDFWNPQPQSLLHIGQLRYLAGQLDDLLSLEPIYLRPSAAEQQWQGGSRQ